MMNKILCGCVAIKSDGGDGTISFVSEYEAFTLMDLEKLRYPKYYWAYTFQQVERLLLTGKFLQ